MNLQNQELRPVIPDLWDVPVEQLAETDDSVLARSIALYRQRLEQNGLLLSAFNSNI